MKKQVQQIGVRKWFGDDWISMQDELFAVLEGFYGEYAQQFILSGCEVDGTTISAGIVGLIDGDGFHLCRFDGTANAVFPLYFYPAVETENRAYLDNEVKPIAETYKVATSGADGGGYLQLKQDGTTPRFFDAIQTATRRFITDTEKMSYAAQAANAISTLRNGVAADYDTLLKVAAALALKAPLVSPSLTGTPTAPTAAGGTNTTQLATTAFVQAALSALGLGDIFNSPEFTGVPLTPTAAPGTNTQQVASTAFVYAAISVLTESAPGVLDTFLEFANALGNDPNFATTISTALAGKLAKANNLSDLNNATTARTNLGLGALAVLTTIGYDQVGSEFKNDLTITANDINWASGWYKKLTLTADTTWTFSNVKKGKDIQIDCSGDFPLTIPVPQVDCSGEYDGTKNNVIQIRCTDDTPGSEKFKCVIFQTNE